MIFPEWCALTPLTPLHCVQRGPNNLAKIPIMIEPSAIAAGIENHVSPFLKKGIDKKLTHSPINGTSNSTRLYECTYATQVPHFGVYDIINLLDFDYLDLILVHVPKMNHVSFATFFSFLQLAATVYMLQNIHEG